MSLISNHIYQQKNAPNQTCWPMQFIISCVVYLNPASQMQPNGMGQWDRWTGHCPGWFKIVFEIFEMIFRKEWHYVVPCRDVVAADHRWCQILQRGIAWPDRLTCFCYAHLRIQDMKRVCQEGSQPAQSIRAYAISIKTKFRPGSLFKWEAWRNLLLQKYGFFLNCARNLKEKWGRKDVI